MTDENSLPPEGLIHLLTQASERKNMFDEMARHEFQTFFDELSLDQMVALQGMLKAIGCSQDNHLAVWFEGILLGMMKVKHNICVTCMVDHDKEIREPILPEEDKNMNEEKHEFSTEEVNNMKEYHLDDLRDQDSLELIGFICTGILGMNGGCGMTYPSIEDRMLRGPEECSGCFARMGQG